MKTRKTTLAAALTLTAFAALAVTPYVWFHDSAGKHHRGVARALVDSITASNGAVSVILAEGAGATEMTKDESATLTLADDAAQKIVISFAADGTSEITNPKAFEGVTVTDDNAGGIVVNSTCADELEFKLSGTGTSLKIYAAAPVKLTLDGVTLQSRGGAALNVQGKKELTLVLADGTTNTLADALPYATPDGEKENAAVFATGKMNIQGVGTLVASGASKHAIASSKSMKIRKGATVKVTSAASDGIHADGIKLDDCTIDVRGTAGDAIDAGDDELTIGKAVIIADVSTDDTKGLKATGDIIVNDGADITVTMSGAQGKALKTARNFTMNGGSIDVKASGGVVVTDGDPSYCTAIKVDTTFTLNAGSIKVVHTGASGKGISVDGKAYFNGGTVDISCSGNGATYTDSTGTLDSHSATCITVDDDIYLMGGTFTLANSGTAGKAIKGDKVIVIGADDAEGPTIEARTTGAKFAVTSGSSWGGGGGRPGGGGGGGQTDYANPKVIKAGGNLTVNSGKLTLVSTQDGGEALESKNILTINGGDVHITTVDDCINASSHIQINGGVVRCVASGNDAIDSNGTLTIAGGIVIAGGTNQPEESFDCDQNTFTITGGTIFGVGGGVSTPTSSVCKQNVIINSNSSYTNGKRITLADASGNVIVSLLNPSNCSRSATALISAAGITLGTQYRILTGGTVTGGETHYELTVGGTISGGTQLTTVTPSSVVTGGSGSGGGPGGGPGGRW
mgnify:FL=1